MKTTMIRSLACMVAGLTCTVGILMTAPIVSAAAPDVVMQAPGSYIVKVAVPTDGLPVTYKKNGQKVTIKPGETAVIPSDATNIKLPRGTFFTVVSNSYTSDAKGGMSDAKGGIPDAKGGIPDAKGGMGGAKGGIPSSNTYVLSDEVFLAGLNPQSIAANNNSFGLVNQTGTIKLPTGQIINLIDAGRKISTNTVNPFNLLQGTDITDGNAPYN